MNKTTNDKKTFLNLRNRIDDLSRTVSELQAGDITVKHETTGVLYSLVVTGEEGSEVLTITQKD